MFKVVNIIGTPSIGGIQIFLKDLSKYDSSYNIKRDILCIYGTLHSSNDLVTAFQKNGAKLHSCTVYPIDRQWRPYRLWKKLRFIISIIFPCKLFFKIKKLKPDIIHVEEFTYLISHLLIGSILNIPTIWHIHSENAIQNKKVFRFLYRLLFRKWVFIISDAKSIVKSNLCFMSSDLTQDISKIPIINVGRDMDDLLNKKTRKITSINNKSDVVIGSLGRLVLEKGYNYLIDSIVLVKNKLHGKNLKLLIAGDGYEYESLNYQIKCNNLTDSIELIGTVENIDAFFSKLDIYVQPSISEGNALAYREAMAYGVPVIATSVGGIPENITDGYSGYLINSKDTKAMAEMIIKVIRMPTNELNTIINNARIVVLEKYNFNKCVKLINDNYQIVFNKTPFKK